MKIAFFDAKPYDVPSFSRYAEQNSIAIKFFETKLNEDTVELANGFDGVCIFVNDVVNAALADDPSSFKKLMDAGRSYFT